MSHLFQWERWVDFCSLPVLVAANFEIAMPEQKDVQQVVRDAVRLIHEYARHRSKDVARGLETPRSAGLLVQKYALGVKDLFSAMYGDQSAREVARAGDAAVESIDPNWREHGRQRWATKPSDLAI